MSATMHQPGHATNSRILTWAMRVVFAVLAAVILINVAALMLAVPWVADAAEALLQGAFGEISIRSDTSYALINASNIAISALGLFIAIVLRSILVVAYPKKIVSVENSIRVACVAVSLLLIELIGSVSRFIVFGDKLTYLKVFNYSGIACIFILSYILFRAAKSNNGDGII